MKSVVTGKPFKLDNIDLATLRAILKEWTQSNPALAAELKIPPLTLTYGIEKNAARTAYSKHALCN